MGYPEEALAPVGREAEMSAIRASMESALEGSGTAGVVLLGPPGAGKTTVWRWGVESARASGFKVLVASPGANEVSLGYAALADLLRAVSSARIEALPLPQRNALRTVLLEEEAQATGTDRAIAAGLLTLLAAMATDAPVCIAIDDLQWMDRSSQRAVGFVMRRLEGARVFVVATQRTGAKDRPTVFDALPAGATVHRLSVGPLSVGALHHVLRSALGATFPRPTLVRITNWAAGNPLLAIEIAHSILALGSAQAGSRAPLEGPGVRRLLGRRIASLAVEQRRTLLVSALAERGSLSQVSEVHARLGWRFSLPDPATGLIAATDETIQFAHPLYAEAVQAAASVKERVAVRLALAAITPRADIRARHLAEATSGTDEGISVTLDAATAHAGARGAIDEAVELAGLAAARSPADSPQYQRRLLVQADLLFRAGDLVGSSRVLDQALAAAGLPAEQVPVLMRIARQGLESEPSDYVIQRCKDIIRLAGSDAAAAAQAHLIWAESVDLPAAGLRHVRAALRLLGPAAPIRLQAQARILAAMLTSMLGRPVDMRSIDAAVEMDVESPPERVIDRAQFVRAWLLLMADDLSRSREDLLALQRLAEETGDESSMSQILANLGHLEIRAGNWSLAHELSTELLHVAERAGQHYGSGLAHAQLGRVAALTGDEATALRHLDEAHAIGLQLDDAFLRSISLSARAVLALGDDRHEEAFELLMRAKAEAAGRVMDPGMLPSDSLDVEVAARVGRIDEARVLADDLERRAKRARRRRVVALVARSRALIAAADGDLELALAFARRSSRMLQGLPAPFEHARSQLILGSIQRRRREKRAADITLASAREEFARLGAAAWVRQVDAERARIGLRPRAPSGLTPTEALVARLSASGRSNRDVARAAFISPKTVEANLARVYRKLGISTRAELGRKMASPDPGTERPRPD